MPAFVVRRKYLTTTPILVFDREPYCELETDLKIVPHDTRPLDFRKVWTPGSWVMFLALFGLEIMIFLCYAYLTFECLTLLLEEDRLPVISMWSAKECGWSEIKVNASPKDQH